MVNMIEGFKPMLASEWHEDKLKFPCIVQAKIDGICALNQGGKLLGRSLKQFANKYVTQLFSKPEYHGFQGEMIVGKFPAAPDLCRNTTSALNRIEGEPEVTWFLFDYITEETKDLNYTSRIKLLSKKLNSLEFNPDIAIIASVTISSIEEFEDYDYKFLNIGFEGSILRDPDAKYKFGRCGKTFMGCWRVKRFIEEEILVTAIKEGQTNLNEAKTNELGRTERSTHQENMQPNGQVGTIVGKLLKDVLDPTTGKVLFKKDAEIEVSAGGMTAEERKFYFENPDKILKHVVKFKTFPKGVKDKPRFPTYVSIRFDADLVDY